MVVLVARAELRRPGPHLCACVPVRDAAAALVGRSLDAPTVDAAVAAAKAGKHLVIEKPLEITLKRCDRIIKGQAAGLPWDELLQLALTLAGTASMRGFRPGKLA